jgi:hypothetical protein
VKCGVRAEKDQVASRLWTVGDGPQLTRVFLPTQEPSGWLGATFDRFSAPLCPVRLVVVLPPVERFACSLSFVATLGAFTGQLDVVDRQYSERMHEVLGDGVVSDQSQTVLVRGPDGALVRLVEVARPSLLLPGKWERLSGMAHSVVSLSAGADEGAIDLESVRRAFVAGEVGPDWAGIFKKLWAPVHEALTARLPG